VSFSTPLKCEVVAIVHIFSLSSINVNMLTSLARIRKANVCLWFRLPYAAEQSGGRKPDCNDNCTFLFRLTAG
jgi:hypothetical protein